MIEPSSHEYPAQPLELRLVQEAGQTESAEAEVVEQAFSSEQLTAEAVMAADSLKTYIRMIGDGKLLSATDEITLAKKKDAGDEIAKKELAEGNLRLVMYIARNYSFAQVPLMDLIQEGNIGLLRAVDKFDYKMGYRFSTYATWWIRQSITKAIYTQAGEIRLPAQAAEKLRKIRQSRDVLQRELGREPTEAEIADNCYLSEKQVIAFLAIPETVSLESPVGDNETSLQDLIEDDDPIDPEQTTFENIRDEELNKALQMLPERELEVIRSRFGLNGYDHQTLQEVGRDIGTTRERVRQIENKALKKLAEALGEAKETADGIVISPGDLFE